MFFKMKSPIFKRPKRNVLGAFKKNFKHETDISRPRFHVSPRNENRTFHLNFFFKSRRIGRLKIGDFIYFLGPVNRTFPRGVCSFKEK